MLGHDRGVAPQTPIDGLDAVQHELREFDRRNLTRLYPLRDVDQTGVVKRFFHGGRVRVR